MLIGVDWCWLILRDARESIYDKKSATLRNSISSKLSPLAQRIRSDIQICESEVESPERELLRSPTCPVNTPPPCSPCVKGFPSPAPLVFTPCKIPEVAEILSNVKVPPSTAEGSVIKCLNCDGHMGASHQCEDSSSPKETVVQKSRTIKNLQKFCSVCDIFYKSGTDHQCGTCDDGKPERVKCIVCQALGRETSLVLCGSRCPSCGVTANWTVFLLDTFLSYGFLNGPQYFCHYSIRQWRDAQ